jgi:hypothetical protein
MLLSSAEITPPCRTPCLPDALRISLSNRITPSSRTLGTMCQIGLFYSLFSEIGAANDAGQQSGE